MPAGVIDLDAIDEEDEIQPNPAPLPRPPTSDLEQAELLQPSLDIQTQFNHYNKKYFSNKIVNATVEYSIRMTLCAGTCTFRPPNVRIALSEPLLKFRPRSDLLSTLLHEMIHAYLFITRGLSRDGPDGHGPIFMSHAHRINAAEAGVDITPYHEFRAEVDHYHVHHWRCQKCDHLIKRAMNRAPGPTDQFWPFHQQKCGGQYIKIAGPPKKDKPIRPPKNRAVAVGPDTNKELPKGVMKTFRIDDMLSGRMENKVKMVNCPVCAVTIKHDDMNKHLDLCLTESMCTQPQNPPLAKRNDPPQPQELRSPKPVRKRGPDPQRLPESNVFPVTANAKRDPSPQQRIRPVKKSDPVPSPKTYDVMQYIADPGALYNLAVAPNKFPSEQVNKIFRNLPSHLPDTSYPTPKNETKNFLRSLINPESPASRELQAKAIVNPLRFGSNGEEFSFNNASKRLSMTWSDLQRQIKQNSSMDEYGNISLSAKLVNMLFSSPSPKAQCRESSAVRKRPRSNGLVQERVTDLRPKRKRVSEVIKSGSSREMKTTVDGGQRSENKNPKRQAVLNDCPICNMNVGQSGLEDHMSRCVQLSQGQDVDHTRELPSHAPEVVQADSRVVSRTTNRPSGTASEQVQRCPICDVALARQDLEAHVANCMMSTGLADAF